jgi:hypothetical protein
MTLTADQVERIPEVYRDFMLTLKRIVDTRSKVLRIDGLQLGEILDYVDPTYRLGLAQVREVAENLKYDGWVEEDESGFFAPTPRGEELIAAIAARRGAIALRIPPLPKL